MFLIKGSEKHLIDITTYSIGLRRGYKAIYTRVRNDMLLNELPIEILQRILLLAICGFPISIYGVQLDITWECAEPQTRLITLQVCSLWYDIINSSRRAWSTIFLTPR